MEASALWLRWLRLRAVIQGSEKRCPLLLPGAAQSLPYIRMRMETEMCTLKSGTGRWNESRALVLKKQQEGRERERGKKKKKQQEGPEI